MQEVFKDIPNYEGIYQVSNLGNVKSLKFNKEKIIKSGLNSRGYMVVVLSKQSIRETRSVHQLVALVFMNHKSIKTKIVIDHINDIKTDNRLKNLQIVSHRFNIYKTKIGYSSNYKGVHFSNFYKKWIAKIQINKRSINLGYFDCELKAHLAYQNKLKQLEL
jgi:hypothetical protein